MACNCIHDMNADMALANANTKVGDGLLRHKDLATGKSSVTLCVEIATYKINTKRRGSTSNAIPTFCPFCGLRYFPLDESPTEKKED